MALFIKKNGSLQQVAIGHEVSKSEQQKSVSLDLASGDQVVTPDNGQVLTQVTIKKPDTLVAENIKNGISIGGVIGNYIGGGGGGVVINEITYSDFVDAIGNEELEAGEFYRITDYVTKISNSDSKNYFPFALSAEHPFDLIVLATSENTYCENVMAIQHSGDTYFNECNLQAWELKWTHLNDTNVYAWADENDGKGVIYYLKDENNNEAFYDFKNIKYLQFALERIDDTSSVAYSFEYNQHSSRRFGTFSDFYENTQNGVFEFDNSTSNIKFKAPYINVLGDDVSSIEAMSFIDDFSSTTLNTLYDWDSFCDMLGEWYETTITLSDIASDLGFSVAELEAMTNLDVIQQILYGDFYYTFDFYDDVSGNHYDLSILKDDFIEYKTLTCFNNKITSYYSNNTQYLNYITFQNDFLSFSSNCFVKENIIDESYSISLGKEIYYNTITLNQSCKLNNCYQNTLNQTIYLLFLEGGFLNIFNYYNASTYFPVNTLYINNVEGSGGGSHPEEISSGNGSNVAFGMTLDSYDYTWIRATIVVNNCGSDFDVNLELLSNGSVYRAYFGSSGYVDISFNSNTSEVVFTPNNVSVDYVIIWGVS